MKKLGILTVSIIMAVAMCACGAGNAVSSNEITDLLDKGLVITQTSSGEDSFRAIVQTDGGFEEVYLAEASMTSEKYEELNQLDMGAEDYNEQVRNFVGTLDDARVTDISDQVPGSDDFDSYRGKTVGDLIDEGYDNTGYVQDGDGWIFSYDGPKYSLDLKVKGDVSDMDDLSPNVMKKFVIESVEFKGFSSMFIDNV